MTALLAGDLGQLSASAVGGGGTQPECPPVLLEFRDWAAGHVETAPLGPVTLAEGLDGSGSWFCRLSATGREPVTFWSLDEVAMALHHSGQRLTRSLRDDPSRLAELALAGVRRAGGVASIRWLARRTRELNGRLIADALTPAQAAERNAIWTDRRSRLCTGLALWVTVRRYQDGRRVR